MKSLFYSVTMMLFFILVTVTLNAQISLTASAGTTTGTYSTLKASFDAINAGTHQGTIVITVTTNTTETAAAVLNASGSGSASYTSINIYPTTTGLSISGNLATPLIDLNGTDNVTIDGRVNATGSTVSLTITNTNTTGGITIRFINDATYNRVQYCNILGSGTSNAIILFSTTTGTLGNSNNTITNNNISCAADANRPTNAVYSGGTPTYVNANDTISNNNIYNFLNRGWASSCGIQLQTYTSAWAITGNSFYETASFIPTTTGVYYVIYIYTAGVNFTISNNYIGGSSPSCGGAAWTKTNAYSNTFYGINISVGTSTASNIQGNIIRNFSWSNSAQQAWTGINVAGGSVNIGTTSGNTIGAATGNGSIVYTGGALGATCFGIYVANASITLDCRNNTIGAITTANSLATAAANFYGLWSASTGTINIQNNVIGSTDAGTSNSIFATTTSTGNQQRVVGVHTQAGTATISGNTISKLTNAATGNLTHSVCGINIQFSCICTATNNIIRDLTSADANTSANLSSCVGINLGLTSNRAETISGNTIYNLQNINTSPAAVNLTGIYCNGMLIASTVKGNFIHDLSVNSGNNLANIYGIQISSGLTTYSNNIITIGGNTTTNIYGIYETGAASHNNSLYFNTVYIGGAPTSGALNSYALYSAATTNTRNFRNNIFVNARSNNGATGKHYAAYFNYAVSTNLTLDYNDYYAPGTGGVLGYYNAADVTSLPLIATMDANSLAIDPVFANAGGITVKDYYLSATLNAVTGTGITTDYSGITRDLTTPRLGALEINGLLPITLISFTGKVVGNSNQLQWITASETNNRYFQLQRSADGINFATIATINSMGNSSSNQYYNYTDAIPLSGRNYYRLKQADMNGGFVYSAIISITNSTVSKLVLVYPNPTNGIVMIETSTAMNAATIRILDISGKIVAQKINITGSRCSFDITQQPAGIYFVELMDAATTERIKMVKQ